MAKYWYPAPAVVQVFAELKAEIPGRSIASDGIIGNAEHSSRDSEHNPNERGSVNAGDITVKGIADPYALVMKLIKDPRTWYVIYNRTIWSRTNNFRPKYYGGANAHTHHIHFSIRSGVKYENDKSSWGIETTLPRPVTIVEKSEDVDDKDIEKIALRILNFPVTANGEKKPLVSHMAESFVADEAQSKALHEMKNQLKSLRSTINGLM